MKKLLWVAVLFSSSAFAQELDTTAVDTVEIEPPPYYLGVYLEGGMSFEASTPTNNFMSIVGVGVQYEKWFVGFSRNDFQGTTQSFVVFPNSFELKYRYAGISLGYQFYQNNLLAVSATGGYYLGDAVWRNLEDGQDFLRDEFNLVKLGIRGEVGKFRYIKPYIAAGYQKMGGLNITNLNESDFSGLFVAAGIRIGYFNQ